LFKRVLAATDFSDSATAAWYLALDIALVHRSGLTFVHVFCGAGMAPGALERLQPEQDDVAQRLLAAADLAKIRGVRIEVLTAIGDPAEVILAQAAQRGSDLIVLGRHETERAGVLIGSVSERVSRRAVCPVLVVGAGSQVGLAETDHHQRRSA
jgi:nucleotide-binding universal stress UspA family protein